MPQPLKRNVALYFYSLHIFESRLYYLQFTKSDCSSLNFMIQFTAKMKAHKNIKVTLITEIALVH